MATKNKRKKVCLFGLSADPPTGDTGHVGIVNRLVEEDFDEVRILPVYRHTFKEKRERLVSYDDRIIMSHLAFGGIPKTTISEAERICFEKAAEGLTAQEMDELQIGTADLLDMLIENEPNSDFTFALGADAFMDLTSHKWKKSRHVLNVLDGRLVVIYRSIMEDEQAVIISEDPLKERVAQVNKENSSENARILRIEGLEPISSTMARNCSDTETLRKLVAAPVFKYIRENFMYGLSLGPRV